MTNFFEVHLYLWAAANSLKEYSFYRSGPLWTEFDIAELVFLSGPKIMTFAVGDRDSVTKQWAKTCAKINYLYEELDQGDQLGLVYFPGQHELTVYPGVDLLLSKLVQP